MIEIIEQVRQIVNFDELDMRIGIHTVTIYKNNSKKQPKYRALS